MSYYLNTKHAMSSLQYEFVFCSRYARKLFLEPRLNQRFLEITTEVCQEQGFRLVFCETHDYWIHLKLEASPELSPCDILTKIRYRTSKVLRDEFEFIQHLPSLWTRKYLVSTHPLETETISMFLQTQKKRG